MTLFKTTTAQITGRYIRAAMLFAIVGEFSGQAIANDIVVGKFASLPSKSPPLEANILEIYIVPKGDKYIVTEFSKGEFKLDYLAKRCASIENYVTA